LKEVKTIKCIVIDDEDAAIEVLQHFILLVPYLSFAGGYISPLEGLQAINEQDIDLVFLDIQMPEITGLDLIKNIKTDCKVILTTAYSQFALDGYELNVADYLLKPIAFPRFVSAVEKVKDVLQAKMNFSQEKDFILVKGELKGKLFKIELDDIDYIEGMRNYASIVCKGKKIVSLLNLKDLEEKLPPNKFIRVHKSFIVSTGNISMIEGNQISMKNHPHISIQIGDTYKAAFMNRMKDNLID
jgi:two-component system LytT family response regulator